MRALALVIVLIASPALAGEKDKLELTPAGYAETSWAWNFNEPANGITNARGFDNRHNTFLLQNAAGGVAAAYGGFEARIVLQFGSTGASYYLAEPAVPGTAYVNPSGSDVWRYIQEAWAAYKIPIGHGLRIQAGLCLSPVGPEGVAVKDNWNWSRSNLFFGLPFYHVGVRASYDLSERTSVTVSGFNGWNDVVDNNDAKSIEANLNYKIADKLNFQVLYFGGVERPKGAPEGQYWRNLFDAYVQWDLHPRLSVLAQVDGGFEPNRFGTSGWFATALYGRVKAFDWLYFAARGDVFYESVAPGASPIFWPSSWVSSQTATIDVRPMDNISFRLEYRHDRADGPTYFSGAVVGDGSTANPFIANARAQSTWLVGATGWF